MSDLLSIYGKNKPTEKSGFVNEVFVNHEELAKHILKSQHKTLEQLVFIKNFCNKNNSTPELIEELDKAIDTIEIPHTPFPPKACDDCDGYGCQECNEDKVVSINQTILRDA